ncbi:2'-5' RNA ligase family protein [Streptomyces sp. ISL-100]|uniref:2'-5' RNA ligase family protein n=1 Tax=Streptomyces sp. ISL-100 TaxID=2819173 RepID=UPI001BEB2AB7|nr:2'-5' RNA ligase family protein [Streptomyces sp. ISL-100]MBT2395238.1 2'-5' RNA ligase family protein [Streptomyces sp. ISL-100]
MPTAPTSRAPAPRKGICRAIFAVTGVVDEVADLIVPGAFAHTLATRPVKTVWHHEWKEPIGVVLDVAEWQPGDPRFADIPSWPSEAGALVATIAFNLRTSKGRDVYEQVRQWHDHGEAQFSIGYRVPPSGATKRPDGVRVIHKLDLYEVSPVLHGAHPMTRSLEVKADPGSVELEHKTTASSGHIDIKAAEQQVGRGSMVALYLPAGTAAKIAHSDGTDPRDLHITLAYLGDADQLPGHPDDLAQLVAASLDGVEPLIGQIGGIGRFPASTDGEPTFVPVDVPGLTELRTRILDVLAVSPLAGAVRTDHGFTPHITLGYNLPADIPAVPPIPVSFDTVHVVRGPDATPVRLTGHADEEAATSEGLAQLVKNDLGMRARGEAKTARATVLEAKTAGSRSRRGRTPENKSARTTVFEAKSRITLGALVPPIQPLPASYEEIRDRVGAAVRQLLATEEGTWVCIEATYPDRAIVSVHQDGGASATYSVPYDGEGREISLGAPQAVELTTVVIPDQGPARPADADETTDSLVVRPAMSALADVTARVQAADGTEQLEPLRSTVEELVAALSRKGLDVHPDDEDDRESASAPFPMAGSGIDLWDDPYDEPHGPAPTDDMGEQPDDDEDDEATVLLDPDEVKAQLAAIQG